MPLSGIQATPPFDFLTKLDQQRLLFKNYYFVHKCFDSKLLIKQILLELIG